jgi:hypothetical protein
MDADLAAFLNAYRDATSLPERVRDITARIKADSTPAQREFLSDRHRNRALLAPRRVGKTSAFLREFNLGGLEHRGGHYLYIALSRPHAEELLWTPLKEFTELYKIPGRFYEADLKFEFRDTGSVLHLLGADDKKEADKKRGGKYHGAGIDEAAAFGANQLRYLIDQVLRPALMDFRGWLALGGTPGPILDGEFYQATRIGAPRSRPFRQQNEGEWEGKVCRCPGACTAFEWSLHRWTIDDAALPHIREEAETIKETKGWTDENPIYRREYRGEWASDESGLVYKYRKHVVEEVTRDDGEVIKVSRPWNTWTPDPKSSQPFGLPEGHKWRFTLGVDLGNRKVTQEERKRNPDKAIPNRTALELLAYADTCRDLYHAAEMTLGDLDAKQGRITELAGRIHWLKKKIGGEFDGIFIDLAGAGGLVLDELAARHLIAAEAAEKKNKPDAIEIWNADLVDGHLKILEGSQLEQEMLSLQWDEVDPTRENKSQANDHCDAGIYARRGALHHFSHEPGRKLTRSEEEQERMAVRETEQTRRARKSKEREFDESLGDEGMQMDDWGSEFEEA